MLVENLIKGLNMFTVPVFYHRDHLFIALFLLDYGLGFGAFFLFVCLLVVIIIGFGFVW